MGVTFKGIHSSTIPSIWKTTKKDILPSPKVFSVNPPEADSEYDFSECNDEGRLHYNDRIISGTLTVVTKNMYDMQKALTKLAKWLIGSWGQLEFDDMPGTVWTAKIENIDSVQYELNKAGIASIYFRVKPFSKLEVDEETGGILLNSSTPIESNLPLDLNINENLEFANNVEIVYENFGDWYTKPVIKITGTFGYIELLCNGKTFRYNGGCTVGQTVIIDCKTFITTKNDVEDSNNTIGDYFEMFPGTNTVTILTDGTGQINIKADYNFIYGVVV